MSTLSTLNHRRVFCITLAAGTALALGVAGYARANGAVAATVSSLTDRVAISEQLKPEQLADLKARGYTTIIDLRPDGEAPDQPSAAHMGAAAHAQQMAFVYVPVQPGAIPDSAVSALHKALTDHPGQVLMYCRSGKRAARTWGLVEASRADGANVDAILAALTASGQSADDLRQQLAARVAARQPGQKAAL